MDIKKLGGELLDLAYPNSLYCICCKKIIDDSRVYRLCDTCIDEIRWANGRICSRCGKPLSEMNPGEVCYNCRENQHEFDRGFTVCEYNEHARSIVFALKYGGRTDIAATIALMMHDKMSMMKENSSDRYEYDVVMPVPMYKDKKVKRGFNQAALIAREFAKYENIKCEECYIRRIRASSPMRGLTPLERQSNIRGAFALTKYAWELENKRILIIDDIYTTGATLDEMTRLLRKVKASVVDIFTFAAGADVVKGE